MSEKDLENKEYDRELINDEVLSDITILSYEEMVGEFVDRQTEISELIDPELGEPERERRKSIIKDEVFIDSLAAIADLGLDSDGNGVVDSEDIDDTLLALEETTPSILDLFIGTAYAETVSRKKVKKAGEAVDSVRVRLSNGEPMDYKMSQEFAELLFNMDELKEEDKPIMYAFGTGMALTLQEYYLESSTEPSVDEVLRALKNLAEMMYSWNPLQQYDEKQLESYSDGEDSEKPRSDSIVLAEFFVDVMYKSMAASGDNEAAFAEYLSRLWNIIGLSNDPELIETLRTTLNIEGARGTRSQEGREKTFRNARNEVLDNVSENDLELSREDTKKALGRCRRALNPTDKRTFESMFISGNFEEKDFEKLKDMKMNISVRRVLKGAISTAVGDTIADNIPFSGREEDLYNVSDLFKALGLTFDNLGAAYSASNLEEELQDAQFSLPAFDAKDVAKYLWENKEDKAHVKEAFREYARKVQRDIDKARTVESTEEYENSANLLSAVGLMLSDNLAADAAGGSQVFGIIGGATVAFSDIYSAKERLATMSENIGDSEGPLGYIGMNVLDYSLHNTNLLPYLAWINGANHLKSAHFARFLVAPGIGNATIGRTVPQLTGLVGLKIIIADVILDIHIDDETGELSFGLPIYEQHARNLNEDAIETLVGVIHLLIAWRGAKFIRDLPNLLSSLKNLGGPKQPGGKLAPELGLNRGSYESSGDDGVKPTGDKLSPEAMKQGVEAVGQIERLGTPIEHRGRTFTHKGVIMQHIQFDGGDARRVVVRLFDERTGDYFDIEYILDENDVRIKRSVGEVKTTSKRVGRLISKENPFEALKRKYNVLRNHLTSRTPVPVVEGGDGATPATDPVEPARRTVDIPGVEDKVTITSEAIQAEPPRSGRIGTRYTIERVGPNGNYRLYVQHLNDGSVRLSLVGEDGVFAFRDRAVRGRFSLLGDLQSVDPARPYVRSSELSALDQEFFRDTESLFSSELDRFVEGTRNSTGLIDGDYDFHFDARGDAAEAYLEELRARERVKAVLDGFGENHTTPMPEEMDIAELRRRYAAMGEVIGEANPRSFNGEMFNRRVILVSNLENGASEVTIRLFQDRQALRSGGRWDRLRRLWAKESYCDVTYVVDNGAVVGDPVVGEWRPVSELGIGNTAEWVTDYETTRSIIEPDEVFLEDVDELRGREARNALATEDYFRYAGEVEVDGARRQFAVNAERQADGSIRLSIEMEQDGRMVEVYRNADMPEGRITDLIRTLELGEHRPLVDAGLYAEDGVPLAMSDPDEIARFRLHQEFDRVIRGAENRTSGAVRALDQFTPVEVSENRMVFDSETGPRQRPTVDLLEGRLNNIRPNVTGVVELAHPLRAGGGVFTHVTSMSFENIQIIHEGMPMEVHILEQDIFFDPKRNLIRRVFRFGSMHGATVVSEVVPTENVAGLMQDHSYLVEIAGENAELRGYLADDIARWEADVRSGQSRTTAREWVRIRGERALDRLPPRLRSLLVNLHLDERGQVDPVELIRGIIDYLIKRPANALYGPDTKVGQFLNKLKTDPAYRKQFFKEMKVGISEGLTPKMNALEGLGAIMMVVFAITMADHRLSAANADEAGKSAAPAMVGFGAGMAAAMVTEPMIASLKLVKAAPGLWGKALVFAGGFVVGMTAGIWAHHSIGVPFEERHPMFAHYVGAGGEILFSGAGITDLLMMGITKNTDDIYVWMNESVPGVKFNFRNPEKRWVDLENFRWHAGVHKDWTLAWNKEVDGHIEQKLSAIELLKYKIRSWEITPMHQANNPDGKEEYEGQIARLEKEIEVLKAKRITDENEWRDGQLIELIAAKDNLDQGRAIAKAHLRMATLPSRAISYIHELGEEYLPEDLYESIVKLEGKIFDNDLEAGVREILVDKLYQYRVMATAILTPHVNAIAFYQGGFGGMELSDREQEDASRFDIDGLVEAETIFLEQPADKPYFSREKGLKSSIMGTPGAEILESVAEAAAEDGRPYLSQSVGEYIMMQDAIASRVVTLEAYEILPPNWEEKAEELRREKMREELPEELQFLIAFLEEVDEVVVSEKDI